MLDQRTEAVALAYARETFPLAERLDGHMETARREAVRFLAMLDSVMLYERAVAMLPEGLRDAVSIHAMMIALREQP